MLTDKQCKNASCIPGKARVRIADSGGLYLEVTPHRVKALVLEVPIRRQGETLGDRRVS